ncbi:unnamed protein product [Ceutorhynchus assimilis]|uniref:Myb/SANT-like DNA-binding domain-containing protein n=1 Tax=Ceutorhynchus assimilis TaxID=467358 RepID=A0A9N9QNK8_9CUCU|nr:unnamed protein product [Ceutorhynchus assimilis]
MAKPKESTLVIESTELISGGNIEVVAGENTEVMAGENTEVMAGENTEVLAGENAEVIADLAMPENIPSTSSSRIAQCNCCGIHEKICPLATEIELQSINNHEELQENYIKVTPHQGDGDSIDSELNLEDDLLNICSSYFKSWENDPKKDNVKIKETDLVYPSLKGYNFDRFHKEQAMPQNLPHNKNISNDANGRSFVQTEINKPIINNQYNSNSENLFNVPIDNTNFNSVHIAIMKNLLKRFINPVDEVTQLRLIMRDLLLYYQQQLVLCQPISIMELKSLCHILEDTKLRSESFQGPPLCNTSILEPELAYRRNVSDKNHHVRFQHSNRPKFGTSEIKISQPSASFESQDESLIFVPLTPKIEQMFGLSTVAIEEAETAEETFDSECENNAGSSNVDNNQDQDVLEGKFYWEYKAILLMLEEYRKRISKFRNPKFKKKLLWDEIANVMKLNGYLVGSDTIDKKMRNLKNTFRTIVDNNNKKKTTGRGRMHWP